MQRMEEAHAPNLGIGPIIEKMYFSLSVISTVFIIARFRVRTTVEPGTLGWDDGQYFFTPPKTKIKIKRSPRFILFAYVYGI
ncbi:hypothetical protein EV356DRAFT_508380 [Viridothelium virens]|uniref:Uncharacterized protein n=1 Tax=Viridothelium virens TaxID=1048519 RepID=A0A6A6GXT4_VIRVR|nr:hypothetical protein EV356DRAFT_508380 [Viridothelium virens]